MAPAKKTGKAKPQAKPKPAPLAPSATMGRNVTNRNAPTVRKSSAEIWSVLKDPKQDAKAAELLRLFANEADPTKPGYEGNEIIAPFMRAFMQLPESRRQRLMELAGNPENFPVMPSRADGGLPDTGEFEAQAMEEAVANALGGDTARGQTDDLTPQQKAVRQREELAAMNPEQRVAALARRPATFAGSKFVQGKIEDRAPIDRNVPLETTEGGVRRPTTPAEQEKARRDIIEQIIGSPAFREYMAASDPKRGLIPTLSRLNELTQEELDTLEKRLNNPNFALSGASGNARRALVEEMDNVRGMGVDPEMEPLGHVAEKRAFISPEVLDTLKYGPRATQAGEMQSMRVGQEGVDLKAFRQAARDILSGNFDINQAPQEVQTLIRLSNMLGGDPIHRFSDEAPTALPSQEMKDSILARKQADLDEIDRRRVAAALMPTEAPIRQRENITPLIKGTLGLQAPYDPSNPGMTVDQQLLASTRSPADKVMEAIYRASQQIGMASDPDVADLGAEQVARRSDSAGPQASQSGLMPGEVNLSELVPQAFYHYPAPDGQGGLTFPDRAPSADFLADQLIGWYGIKPEAAEEFKRAAVPVLDLSLRRQAQFGPQTARAREAGKTMLIPSMKPMGHGKMFFGSPEGLAYSERMFNPDLPIVRMNPTRTSQPYVPGDMPGTGPATPALSDLLDQPVIDEGDLRRILEAPVMDEPAPGAMPLDPQVPGSSLEDMLNRPVEGDLDLSMNRRRSGLLNSLIV